MSFLQRNDLTTRKDIHLPRNTGKVPHKIIKLLCKILFASHNIAGLPHRKQLSRRMENLLNKLLSDHLWQLWYSIDLRNML